VLEDVPWKVGTSSRLAAALGAGGTASGPGCSAFILSVLIFSFSFTSSRSRFAESCFTVSTSPRAAPSDMQYPARPLQPWRCHHCRQTDNISFDPRRTILRLFQSERSLLQWSNPPLHSHLYLSHLRLHFFHRFLEPRRLLALMSLLCRDFGNHSPQAVEL
jgi:hypothetical protein